MNNVLKNLKVLINYVIQDQINSSNLPTPLRQILPSNYLYQIENYSELEPIITSESVIIGQIIVDLFTNIDTKDGALKWLEEFQQKSKTTMRLTRTYPVKGNKVIFREMRHCIHSHLVRQKNKNRDIKNPYSLRNRNTKCNATLNLRLKNNNLLEINLRFTHNHLPNSAASLSF